MSTNLAVDSYMTENYDSERNAHKNDVCGIKNWSMNKKGNVQDQRKEPRQTWANQ